MPKEQIVIDRFSGVKQSADSRDLDLNTASHMMNIDPLTKQGELRGRMNDDALNGTFIPTVNIALFGDGTDAVVWDGTDIEHVENVNTSPAVSAVTSTPTSSGTASIASFGTSVRVALGSGSSHIPQWVGTIEHGQFSGSAPSGAFHIRDAHLATAGANTDTGVGVTITGAASADETTFDPGYTYGYRASYEYDGFQNGPLTTFTSKYEVPIPTGTYANGAKSIAFQYRIANFSTLPERVTAVTIWRNRKPINTGEYEDAWRRVERIDINDAGWATDTTNKDIPFTDTGYSEDEFEAFTGLSETNTNSFSMSINYQYNAELSGYHFVADVYQVDLASYDTSNWMFRSLRNRPDMFNWAEDYLVLPTAIHSLKSFLGRLYAFSDGVIYRIDPETFQIEDTITGVGASSPQSIVVTERGMFFCNSENLYVHDGQQIRTVGYPVLDNDYDSTISWIGASHGIDPVCTYDGSKDIFIAIFESASSTYHAFCYHLPTDTWYTYSFGALGGGAPTVGFISHDGKPIVVFNGTYAHIGGDSSRSTWKWVSKEINNGLYSLVPYTAFIDGDATNLVVYEDCKDPYTLTLSSDTKADGCYHRVRTNSQVRGVDSATSWGRYNKIKYEMNGSGTDSVNALGIVVRRVRNHSFVAIPEYQEQIVVSLSEDVSTAGPVHGLYSWDVPSDKTSLPWFTDSTPWVGNLIDSATGTGASDILNDVRVDVAAGYIFSRGDSTRELIRHNLNGTSETRGASVITTWGLDLRRSAQKVVMYNGSGVFKEYDYDLNFERNIYNITRSSAGMPAVDQSETYMIMCELNSVGDDFIVRVNLSSGTAVDITNVTSTGVSGADNSTAVIDEDAGYAFLLLSAGAYNLYRIDYPSGNNLTSLATNLGDGLSIDRTRQKLITATLTGDIQQRNYDNSSVETIMSLTTSMSVRAVDIFVNG